MMVNIPAPPIRRFTRLCDCLLACICLTIVDLLPLGAAAQITEPLLPLLPAPAPPIAPEAPSATPGPSYPGATVTNRPRPEFNPNGVRFDDYFWYPRVELDESYNGNIFATPTHPSSDLITALAPSFDLLSIFPRDALNLHGSAYLQNYATHSNQNAQSGIVSADGRLDVTGQSSLYGTAQVSHPYISYGSPNSPMAIAEPVTYWDYLGRAGYQQGGGRLSYQLDLGVEASQYNGVPLTGGGVLPQSSQNTTISDAAIRTSYELAPDYLGFIRVGGAIFNYWNAPNANSKTYRVDLGLQILPRHIIYGEAYAGYLIQNFAQSGAGSISTPDYGGQLVWNVTPLNTLTFTGARTFYTGTPSNGSTVVLGPAGNGYLSSTIAVNADHELLRNLLVNLNAGYENDSFQGIVRNDNVFTGGAGSQYLINRHLFLGGTFSIYRRTSTFPGVSYTQSIVMLRIGTQL
jgi:hypothetical protein